jgi:hypothetical protein
VLPFIRSHRAVGLACCAIVFITWVDVLDEIATLTLLQQPGYREANPIALAFGVPVLIAVKLLVPIALGLLLLILYRARPALFRIVTAVLWLAIPVYVAVVAHNLQLLFTR